MTSEKVETKYGVDFDDFMSGYIDAMLFSTNDDNEVPLDTNYDSGDFSPEMMERVRADCLEFLNDPMGGRLIAVAERLDAEGKFGHRPGSADDTVANHAGRDFWYTREGHGCGFWDGDWREELARPLEKLAKRFGEMWITVGDEDGLLYC